MIKMSYSGLNLSSSFLFILIVQFLSRVSAIRYEYLLLVSFGSLENLEKLGGKEFVLTFLVFQLIGSFITGTAYLNEFKNLIRNVCVFHILMVRHFLSNRTGSFIYLHGKKKVYWHIILQFQGYLLGSLSALNNSLKHTFPFYGNSITQISNFHYEEYREKFWTSIC